jgi:hypothetical protein
MIRTNRASRRQAESMLQLHGSEAEAGEMPKALKVERINIL